LSSDDMKSEGTVEIRRQTKRPSLTVEIDDACEPQSVHTGGAMEALALCSASRRSPLKAPQQLLLPFSAGGGFDSAEGRLAFFVDSVFNVGECRAVIAAAECFGFDRALVNEGNGREVLDVDTRNCDRCMIDDEPFAAELYERVRSALPQSWTDGSGQAWRAVGLNERLRILRYKAGSSFARHMDGGFERAGSGERSFMTVMLYLNDGEAAASAAEFQGGSTHFMGFEEGSAASERAVAVAPRVGRVLAFEHWRVHEGEVVRRGVKYALLTDVVFARAGCEVGREATEPSSMPIKSGGGATQPGSCHLDGLPSASYLSDFFASDGDSLYEQATQLHFPHRNRGITRAVGAPHVALFSVSACGTLDGDDMPLPPVIAGVIRRLVDSGSLRKMPTQVSVNHYTEPSCYCMVPHKDGYADQTAVVSLGSDTSLEFWCVPMTAEERLAREMMHESTSGTSVHDECLQRPCDAAVWLEPGSVLLLEREALDDYVHGLRASDRDVFAPPPVDASGTGGTASHVNANFVKLDALCQRAAIAGPRCAESEGFDDQIELQRLPRVSIVLWTEWGPAGCGSV